MNADFSNSVILPENMPVIQDTDFIPVDRKYLKIIYIQYLIVGLVMSAFILLFVLLPKDKPMQWIVLGTGVVSALLFFSFLIISYLSFPKRGYLIREKDIAYQRGLIQYKLTSIPYNRIQHVVLNQGIIAKKMGLASLKVFTAGTSSDDLNINGLPIETAKQIREFLTGKISSDV